jgi:hypothetical protein
MAWFALTVSLILDFKAVASMMQMFVWRLLSRAATRSD